MAAITRGSNNQDQELKPSRAVGKQIDLLDKKIDSIYKDIYITRTDNNDNLNNIINSIDNNLDKLRGENADTSGMSELISRLYKDNYKNSEKMMHSVADLFSNENLIGSIFLSQDIHQYIAYKKYNYDLICKYLPRLNDAIEILRDNVLGADSMNNKYLYPKSVESSKDAITIFNSNVDKLEEKYDVSEFFDDTWTNVAKYGEDFIYVVPYPIAFKRMMERMNKRACSSFNGPVTGSIFESYTPHSCLSENYAKGEDFKSYASSINTLINEEDAEFIKMVNSDKINLGAINLYFNETGVIEDSINECTVITEANYAKFESLVSLYESEGGMSSIFSNKIANRNKGKQISGVFGDGLVIDKGLDKDPDKIRDDILGAVFERLPMENVTPCYIGKKCIGYYYFEFAEDPDACGFCGGHHFAPGLAMGSQQFANNMSENQQELVMRFIASKISNSIDTKFINNNVDLKEEIYAILRYNEKFDINRTNNIGVTFIPAEDIIHCYFKLHEKTHRGISLLQNALIPAMLYILLYLTDIIGKITRSTDKRVYYVKQTVETNVARSMMNVIDQIKKGNMGIRQIESMNNILNIVGKYNDYLIPVGPSGDRPVEFDIMQGQNIDTPTDMMQTMEESAVNTIMPYELVNAAYQQDFAIKYTMSNLRLLNKCFNLRRRTLRYMTKGYTRLYNFEFGKNYAVIEIVLPPPIFLASNNTNQLWDAMSGQADKIIETEYTNDQDEYKMEFKKLYLRENLNYYMDYNMIDRIKDQAKLNVEIDREPAVEEDSDIEDAMNDEF